MVGCMGFLLQVGVGVAAAAAAGCLAGTADGTPRHAPPRTCARTCVSFPQALGGRGGMLQRGAVAHRTQGRHQLARPLWAHAARGALRGRARAHMDHMGA
eukprot:354861-Chlamydomonas_euryale.AAC.20